jgi:H+/Cl- antiporter ClcA
MRLPAFLTRGGAGSAATRTSVGTRLSGLAVTGLGALLGGMVGGTVVVVTTLVLKAGIGFAAGQSLRYILVAPLLGLVAAVLILHGRGTTADTEAAQKERRLWRAFPHEAVRADINADVVDTAGEEEKFPWHRAPIRAAAIIATVGSGAGMGTEAPAAYLGEAAGVFLGDRRQEKWRRVLRPAALAGGAAGVSALMGMALVGPVFMLELGRRRRAPLNLERILAGIIGGLVGWGIDVAFGLQLIRFVIPDLPPGNVARAIGLALAVGVVAGGITATAGLIVYNAKNWRAAPTLRLVIGGAGLFLAAFALAKMSTPSAAVGPGGGAILWAEAVDPKPISLLAASLLRAGITIAAVAAGGCGGVFIPFLVVGDLAGRIFAPVLGVGRDLAGAAGAAGGIAGGYHLPFTAAAMVLGIGGPPRAILICLLALVVAARVGTLVSRGLELVWERLFPPREAHA